MIGLCDIIVKRSGSQIVLRDVDDAFIEAFLFAFECNSDLPTEIDIVPSQEREVDEND